MDIHFTDPNHGVIIFYTGLLTAYRTSDAGAHWQQLALPGDAIALAFPGADRSWALASNRAEHSYRLFSTTDGGATWDERMWPAGAEPLAYGIFGVSADSFSDPTATVGPPARGGRQLSMSPLMVDQRGSRCP